MGDPYRKLPSGSPVTAFSITAYNRMIDMLRWYEAQQRFGGGRIGRVTDWDQSVFRVRNDTGADLMSYSVVGLDGPIFDPTDGGEPELLTQTSQKGVEPTVEDHAGGKWGVMLEAAPSGKIGRCCLAGVVPVRLYVTDPSAKSCDVIAAETVGDEEVYLGTGGNGAQILWMEEGAQAETIVWAIVRLGPFSSLVASAYYQLITALDCDTILAFANPTVWDSENYQWKDDHSASANQHTIDPEWTVMVANTTRAVGAWQEDFVACQLLAETYESDYYDDSNVLQHGTFRMVEVVNRLSNQFTYVAYIPGEATLAQGGFLENVDIYVNGIAITRTLYDIGLLAAGQSLVAPLPGIYVKVGYFADLRKWCLTGAQCNVTEMLT